MSAVQRQIAWGLSVSVLLFVFLTTAYLYMFPLSNWSELWDQKVMDIPFIIFIFSFSLASGIIFGVVSGIYWRKQFQAIEGWLYEIEEGRKPEFKNSTSSMELEPITLRVEKLQKLMTEQTKVSQRLATEKAEELENRIQEIISQERNRLARELHDSVSQQLFAASMMMSAINETKPASDDRETKQLKMVEEMIHQSQLEMRALLLHLRPVALKGKTLQEGMEELLVELQQKVTMNIQWKIEDFPLDKGIEDHLFRILQETVSNTLRHAKATKLEVLLISRDNFVILRIVDDGIGFEVEESNAGSYGMQNMNERAMEIGGTLKVVSVKNKGTRLEVKVPIVREEGEKDND